MAKVKSELLPVLEKAGMVRTFEPDEMVYFQEDELSSFYFVKKGRVRAFFQNDEGNEMTVEVLGEGRVFGESSLLSQSGKMTSVQAVSQTELISLTMNQLIPCLQNEPELMQDVFELMAATIQNLSRQVVRLSFMEAPARVADFLLQVSEDPDPSLSIINRTLPYSHMDVAESVNLTRSTVSRILKQFEEEKLIQIGYKKIRILDSEKLKKKVLRK